MGVMLRLTPKFLIVSACVALVAGSAQADDRIVIKKRVGFFESLFGTPRRKPRATIFGNDGTGQKLTWWEEKQLQKAQDPNINIIYGYEKKKPKSKPQVIASPEYAEPEPLPGLGMGTLAYQPPLVAPVFNAAFAKLTAASPEADAIRLVLSNRNVAPRANEPERKTVLEFYQTNSFKPLWTAAGKPTARAVAVLKIFADAKADGLVPENYLPIGLSSFENTEQALAVDISKIAAFDVSLTIQALKYARHLSGGQFEPNRLSLYNDIKSEPISDETAIKVLAYSPYPESYLASVAPRNPQYKIFKDQLATLSSTNPRAALDLIATGSTVKPGKTDTRIPQIRGRLQVLGLLSADDAVNNNEELLDPALAAALKVFQKNNKLKQSGALDANTVKAFNTDHSADERQRLVYNMERLRWLPKNLGARYVLVNQPAFEVNVMDHGKPAWTSRVIVGRPLTQTYAFSDQIETVVFNPTWGVPASIIVNEYGPKSRKDPSYLDRNGFKVINAKGELISSRDINWYTFGQTPSFGVQQPSGDGNALGEIKFLFPNSHDIYMHDTPNRNLFNESMRAFSHGCVRVQNPREYAQVLLGWDEEKVAENVESGESHSVGLSEKVPVHMTYFTAWAGTDGIIHYYDDIYGRDIAMAKAFAYSADTKKPNDPNRIVQNIEISGGLTQN
jgi:L,D-transpeptidase YcbB